MVYKDCKINGPYLAKDGRMRVIVMHPSELNRTVSYPKYIMEKHLHRYLDNSETVHHIDGNPCNNNLNNLIILDRKFHASLEAKRLKSESFICPICNTSFSIEGSRLHHYIGKRKAGPFCSRVCVGKYGAFVQNNKMKKLKHKKVVAKYHKLMSPYMETYKVDGTNSGNAKLKSKPIPSQQPIRRAGVETLHAASKFAKRQI